MSGASGTRQAILDAALAIVAEDGLAAVTVVAIRVRSGISNGSIYHHFGTRDGVIRSALLDAFASLTAELADVLDDRDAEECVRDLVARHLAWVGAHRAAATVLYLAPLQSAAAVASHGTVSRKEELARPVAAWFRARAGQSELRALPAWAVDPVVLAPVHEVARRWLANPPVGAAAPDAATVATVADAVWMIVRPTASR